MRQHLPLAATAVQIQERIEHLAHIEFPRSAPLVVAGRWNHGLHDCPLGPREIRGIRLPLVVLLRHSCALLFLLHLAPLLPYSLSKSVSGEPLRASREQWKVP